MVAKFVKRTISNLNTCVLVYQLLDLNNKVQLWEVKMASIKFGILLLVNGNMV